MAIRVNIGSLVLDGVNVPARERPGLQASVERELGMLLAQGTPMKSGGAVPEVRGGEMPSEGPLASRIAHAVYGAISK